MGNNETKRYKQTSVYLDDKTLERLQKIADKEQRSISAQARLYIDQGLENEPKRQP